MTTTEAEKFMEIIQAAYPSFYRVQTALQAETACKLWYDIFKDYPANTVYNALKASIVKKPEFPPSIGDVNNELAAMSRPDIFRDTSGEQAWAAVAQYCANYGEYDQTPDSKAAYDELMRDEPMKLAVQSVGGMFAIRRVTLDDSGTMRAQFIKIYNSIAKRHESGALLPPSLKASIETEKSESFKRLAAITGSVCAGKELGEQRQEESEPQKSETAATTVSAMAVLAEMKALMATLDEKEARRKRETGCAYIKAERVNGFIDGFGCLNPAAKCGNNDCLAHTRRDKAALKKLMEGQGHDVGDEGNGG